MEFDCDGHVLTLSFKPPPAGSSWWIKEKEYRVVSKANLKMWRFSEFLGEKKHFDFVYLRLIHMLLTAMSREDWKSLKL